MVEAIEQARCTECGEDNDNYRRLNKKVGEDDDGMSRILYLLRCSCGVKSAVAIQEDGLNAASNMTHEDATWNQGSEEEEAEKNDE